jgi:hypothetical protein
MSKRTKPTHNRHSVAMFTCTAHLGRDLLRKVKTLSRSSNVGMTDPTGSLLEEQAELVKPEACGIAATSTERRTRTCTGITMARIVSTRQTSGASRSTCWPPWRLFSCVNSRRCKSAADTYPLVAKSDVASPQLCVRCLWRTTFAVAQARRERVSAPAASSTISVVMSSCRS